MNEHEKCADRFDLDQDLKPINVEDFYIALLPYLISPDFTLSVAKLIAASFGVPEHKADRFDLEQAQAEIVSLRATIERVTEQFAIIDKYAPKRAGLSFYVAVDRLREALEPKVA
jgi:hypothetical protein